MNKKLTHFLRAGFIILITVGSAIFVNGQTTVQIGTGTDLGDPTLYGPIYRFSATSTTTSVRSNILLTQAELSSAGVIPGAIITNIQFNKLNNASFVTPASFSIYMGNTSNAQPTTSWPTITSSFSQVYNNTSFNVPATAGWVVWNVTPFVYTGGSLEIATYILMAGNGGATGSFQWEYTSSIPPSLIVATTVAGASDLTASTNATYKHRPNLKITFAPGALPVKLINITAMKRQKNVMLTWSTSLETDLDYFEVERSLDASVYSVVGTVYPLKSGSPRAYSFTDFDAIANVGNSTGNMYYRLKMGDKDGSFAYSPVATVKVGQDMEVTIIAYPNPFRDQVLIKISVPVASNGNVTVCDIGGKAVSKPLQVSLAAGESTFNVPFLSKLQKGTYILSVNINGAVSSLKMIK